MIKGNSLCYREKKRSYKYVVEVFRSYKSKYFVGLHIQVPFIKIVGSTIFIKKGYAWDGPSGPTWDTKNFLTPSLVHDALYQLIRIGQLSSGFRKIADKILYQMCRDRGMSWWRSRYVYKAVRAFGEVAAKHDPDEDKTICIP
jgi:hypothetical protein